MGTFTMKENMNGSAGKLEPKIAGFKVDLDPIGENEVLMNPQRYTYPACPMTQDSQH